MKYQRVSQGVNRLSNNTLLIQKRRPILKKYPELRTLIFKENDF